MGRRNKIYAKLPRTLQRAELFDVSPYLNPGLRLPGKQRLYGGRPNMPSPLRPIGPLRLLPRGDEENRLPGGIAGVAIGGGMRAKVRVQDLS